MANLLGQQIGNYRLIRLIGQGGFATVYLGEHIYLGALAAIKVLHTHLANDVIESFYNEARFISNLIHPNIVRVLDFNVEKGGFPFLVMDYAPNGSLRQCHPKGIPLPLVTIVEYVKQIAAALQYAHGKKLIHRDIKPENMLLGRQKELLLSDFGIAVISKSSNPQNFQDPVGTISYMAPEQLLGKPRRASDQYALGINVYEWLSGSCPFNGSKTQIAFQHLHVRPPSLREKIPLLRPEIDKIVLTALAKEPEQRFRNVLEFASKLEQACRLMHPMFVAKVYAQ